VKQTDVNNKQT